MCHNYFVKYLRYITFQITHLESTEIYRPNKIYIYYIKNQQDATLAVLFISNCKITLHVSEAFCVHHQEY